MIAVGVANPNAQGQAMTSTATALISAGTNSPASHHVNASVMHADGHHNRYEYSGNRIRHPLDRRLGTLRFFNQTNDCGKLGMSADAGGTAFEHSLLVRGRGIDFCTRLFS